MTDWQNRIVGQGSKPASQFLANPRNWRKHPQNQRDAVHASLSEVGWVQQVIENVRTGHLVDGHERIWQAMQNDDADVPFIQVDLSEEEELLVLATLDPMAAMASADTDVLAELLAQVETEDAALQALLDSLADEYDIDLGDEPPEDPGAQIDKAEELRQKWGVELGQVWEVGDHRIACGDCTDPDVVASVMAGERAAMVWTDPPYGVKYGEKLGRSNPIAHRVRSIAGDGLPPADLEKLIRSAFQQACRSTVTGASLYAACPPGTLLPTAIAAFTNSGFDFRWQLVWVKDQLVLGRGDYHFRHENILYGWKSDGAHWFVDERTHDSVFEIPRPRVSEEHPTMKPVELVVAMVANSSRVGELVLDPFLGSGTTLVACERLSRRGRGIELDPGYCAVAIQRLVDMGLTARLAE